MPAFICALATLLAVGLTTKPSPLDRFIARGEEPPVEYRALRHMEADNPHFHQSAWMDVWTDFDRVNGLRYTVVAEGGSGYIRRHVFLGALEGEQKMWANHEPQRASFTYENYTFQDGPQTTDVLATLLVQPKRRDRLLIDGSLVVGRDDGELVRIEGRLSKTPSFWTRRVEIARRYARIADVRVPISIESVAQVLIAGRSTFKMTYEYETINGRHVGDPRPRTFPLADH